MRQKQIALASRHVAAVKDLLCESRDGGYDAEVLGSFELLHGAITRLVSDCLCQQKLAELRTLARALYSDAYHAWARSPLTGSDYLRLQMFKAFNALENRLDTLQEIRSADRTYVAAPLSH